MYFFMGYVHLLYNFSDHGIRLETATLITCFILIFSQYLFIKETIKKQLCNVMGYNDETEPSQAGS